MAQNVDETAKIAFSSMKIAKNMDGETTLRRKQIAKGKFRPLKSSFI